MLSVSQVNSCEGACLCLSEFFAVSGNLTEAPEAKRFGDVAVVVFLAEEQTRSLK